MPPFRNMVSKPRKCVVDLPHSGTYGFETSLNVSMAYTLQGAWFRNQGNVSATCHVQEYGFETSENVSTACPPPCAWFRNQGNASPTCSLSGAWFRNQGNVSATCHVQEYGFETLVNALTIWQNPGTWFQTHGKCVDNLTKKGVRVSYRWLGISFAIHHCSYSSRVVCMVSIVEC